MALLLKAKIDGQQSGLPAQSAPAGNRYPAQHSVSASRPRGLYQSEDMDMARSLSALHIRYGRPHEAIPYLMVIRRERPGDVEATRLLALAFLKLERWDEADRLLAELDASANGPGRFHALWRSLILFRKNRLLEARDWFRKFVSSREF
ncbi:MAG: tetratricopeptide repeat protein [Nitratireductor sp.]